MSFDLQTVLSPAGDLFLVGEGPKLCGLFFAKGWHESAEDYPNAALRETPVLKEAKRQLQAYFARKLRVFDLPLAPYGTEFQKQAWKALSTIPYGETRSYKEQAARIGRPAAVRAVGRANGQNPISIIVPCHRVIGANGKLTGYGGGLGIKEMLLGLEGVI